MPSRGFLQCSVDLVIAPYVVTAFESVWPCRGFKSEDDGQACSMTSDATSVGRRVIFPETVTILDTTETDGVREEGKLINLLLRHEFQPKF